MANLRFPSVFRLVLLADAMENPLRDFYVSVYQRVLDTGRAWDHDYECSSPDTYRIFHERAYVLHNLEGILEVNSLTLEKEHDATRNRAIFHRI